MVDPQSIQISPAIHRNTPGGLEVERCIGRYDSGRPGPLFLVVAGLHGNEPAGVLAAEAILEELTRRRTPLTGRLVALSGNRGALRVARRFLARDLNRVWIDAGANAAGDAGHFPTPADPEQEEQRELLEALRAEARDWPGPILLLDLHTTSADGAPFSIAADTLQCRRIAELLPIPMILGLEERIDGPLLSWIAERGHRALVMEGGSHEAPETVANLIAAIWLCLVAGDGLPRTLPEVRTAYLHLRQASRGGPSVAEIIDSRPIVPGDAFRMLPGFANFQGVEVGQPLAHDRRGVVRSPRRGLMLMPLYQDQGEEGYFLCREIPRSWLRFSERCRRSGMESLLPSLPGVRIHPRRPRALYLSDDAPPVVRAVLRHFGYRKGVLVGAGEILLMRRPESGEYTGSDAF